jgi:nicotinamide-nucleotide amidase
MLAVPETTLERHGAVSEATARAMAQGVLAHSRADWSVAITGIAGPTGGTPEKPVGTVCFAWASRDGGCEAQTCHFDGDRAAVREQSVFYALSGLLARVGAAISLA